MTNTILGWLGTSQPAANLPIEVDAFIGGYSIDQISIHVAPGIGGPALVREQQRIQARLRTFIIDQEETIRALEAEIDALTAALDEAQG